uniref:Probable FAD-binding monooxygenase ltbD n=1 Tax=Aspergillus luteorubrus TaxID=2715282 RepID=LTBD_ASPLT
MNETEYFVVDTPGFEDEGGAWATFCEIAQLLDHIREHAVIVAIFFVTPINIFKRRPDPFEEKLYTWLREMSGERFMKYVTFVTTFWEAHNPDQLERYNDFLVRRKEQEWARFIKHGAQTYQFGKVYSAGVETTLHWDTDAEQLAAQAREMIRVYCHEIPIIQPLILHELNMNMGLGSTAAGQVLWPAGDGGTNDQGPSRAQSTASSGGSGRPRSTESPQSGAQASTTPTSPPTTQSTGDDPAAPGGWAWFREFAWEITKRYGPQIVEHVINRQFGSAGAIIGGNGGDFASSMQCMSAKGFDINSVTDTAKFFGKASDMGSRGPNGPIGNGPIIFSIKLQGSYFAQFLNRWQNEDIQAFDPKVDAVNDFMEQKDLFMETTVWNTHCQSWYKSRQTGKITALWPGSTLHYMETLAKPRYDDFDITYASKNRFAYLGNGFSQDELNPQADITYYIRDKDDGLSVFGNLFSTYNAKDIGDKMTALADRAI